MEIISRWLRSAEEEAEPEFRLGAAPSAHSSSTPAVRAVPSPAIQSTSQIRRRTAPPLLIENLERHEHH